MEPRDHWSLDPTITFLNHGSFGATPDVVLARQEQLRLQMEAEPVRFFVRELPELLETARIALARFVGASPRDLVFVNNVTTAVNAVLRSLSLGPGDELLTTDHEYNACRNILEFVARRASARVVVAQVPFPLATADDVVDAVLARLTPRVKFVLIDHVTSPTGMVLPVRRLVARLREGGVRVMVDGAHAPGMLPLDLDDLGADYYGANCHKWLCAPKGAGFLHVRRSLQDAVRPPVISHGANAVLDGASRFQAEFDFSGTDDPTAWLCVPHALEFLESLLPGGWSELMRRNHDQVVRARRHLCDTLGAAPPCPVSMLGSMASIPIPDGAPTAPGPPTYTDPLQDALLERHRIEVPIVCWPRAPHRLVRVSAQVYNDDDQYRELARALGALL